MSDIVEVAESVHSILGPSSAERWLYCPGSVLASRGAPDRVSKYAIEGTAAHTVSEWVRERGVPASTFKGLKIRAKHGDSHTDVPCGKPMVESVQEFVDTVAKRPGHELIEARVDYEPFVPGGFGTLDSGKLNDWTCYITDFKHGTGVKKDAEWNPQLLLYALGVWLKWSWAYYFDTFVLAISQPRLKHYDEWEIRLRGLIEWANDVARPGAKLALSEGAPFRAGSWCKFCRIRDDCLVRAAYLREAETGGDSGPRRREEEFDNLEE